jgi:hypothetical protein
MGASGALILILRFQLSDVSFQISDLEQPNSRELFQEFE